MALQAWNESSACQPHKVSSPHSIRLIAYCPPSSLGNGSRWNRVANTSRGTLWLLLLKHCGYLLLLPPSHHAFLFLWGGGLISERISLSISSEVYLGWSTCLLSSDRIPYLRAPVSERCMGMKSQAIVPPGCVTWALNKGRKGGDGVGVGWGLRGME